MPIPHTYSFARYLSAKKSVDDRALNHHVWQNLAAALPRATPEKPLHILEVGAGLGTMVERLVASAILTHTVYTAIDLEPTLIAEARCRLPQWATAQGWQVQQDSQAQIYMQRSGQDIRVTTEAIDLLRFVAREQGQRTWDPPAPKRAKFRLPCQLGSGHHKRNAPTTKAILFTSRPSRPCALSLAGTARNRRPSLPGGTCC